MCNPIILFVAVTLVAVAATPGVAPRAEVGAGATATNAQAGEAEGKLETDEPMRKGMIAVRDLVRLNHSLITHRRMPPDHAARFAKAIRAQADEILATSHAPGKDRLQPLLDEIVAGVEAVAHPVGSTGAIDGLERIDAALASYPRQFDHPGWVPIQSLD
jgi:hypothetical protein